MQELLKHKFNLKTEFNFTNCLNILSWLVFVYFFLTYYYSTLKKKNFSGLLLFIIFMSIGCLIINSSMESNVNLTKQKKEIHEIIDTLNTGDIVLFRSYSIHSVFELFYIITMCLQNKYFTHIAIIYKDKVKGKVYIMDYSPDENFCCIEKRYKQGLVFYDFDILHNYKPNDRIHIVKSNIHKYINYDELNKSIVKYSKINFLENGIYCLNLVTKIFQENGLMKNDDYIPYLFDDVIDSKHYNVPIKFEEPIIIKDYQY